MELIVAIVVLGLIFDYTNGFHDAANVVSTVIATRALRPLIAIILAGVLNTIGAVHIGGVAQTITSGLVRPEAATQLMILCAVGGAILWNLLTWYFGMPSSSSYALIGGLVGAVLIPHGTKGVIWDGIISKVLLPMAISPFLGFFLAFGLMKLLNLFAAHHKKKNTQQTFRILQIISASFVALAHGLNDAQKSMGIITLGLFASGMLATTEVPLWVVLSCALVMGLGTASGGFRIIRTVGFQITKIQPIQGFAAETSSSCVILAASYFGMPISSTHMIVGSVTGVGTAKSVDSVRWGIAHRLVLAWVLTIPGSALVSGGAYLTLNQLGLF